VTLVTLHFNQEGSVIMFKATLLCLLVVIVVVNAVNLPKTQEDTKESLLSNDNENQVEGKS